MDELIKNAQHLGAEELKNRIYKLIMEEQSKDSETVGIKELLDVIDGIDWEEKRESEIENETNSMLEQQ